MEDKHVTELSRHLKMSNSLKLASILYTKDEIKTLIFQYRGLIKSNDEYRKILHSSSARATANALSDLQKANNELSDFIKKHPLIEIIDSYS